jgi:hypothetical protein
MSRSSSNYSNAERDFREEMADWDTESYDNDNDNDNYNDNYNEEPPNLLNQIREQGIASAQYNLFDDDMRNTRLEGRNMERYGSQNNGQYNMENFIVGVLELNMRSQYVRMMDAGERTDYIIDKAVEAINSGSKKEIHFTPQENTEYKKIKAIYDKLADDLKKMICRRIGLSPCPHNSDDVITRAIQKFPDISSSINSGMTFGFKLKAIEDYLERETKTNAKGFRKTRRRQTRSKRRTGSKLRKSFRRRRVTRNKRM